MSIALRIAQEWNEYSYPDLRCDKFSLPYYLKYHALMEDLYNKLPLKAKKILDGVTLYLCCADTISKITGKERIIGLSRPGKKGIFYNIEKFVLTNNDGFDDHRFVNLFFHEIGHYLVHNFTAKEREYYIKRFGTTPTTAGEPEADGFAAYMTGVAPYHVQDFWAWFILNNS